MYFYQLFIEPWSTHGRPRLVFQHNQAAAPASASLGEAPRTKWRRVFRSPVGETSAPGRPRTKAGTRETRTGHLRSRRRTAGSRWRSPRGWERRGAGRRGQRVRAGRRGRRWLACPRQRPGQCSRLPKPGNQARGLARFVVLAQLDEGLPDLVVREELRRPSGVFGGDEVHLPERPQGPERQVFQVADRGRDHEQGAGHEGVEVDVSIMACWAIRRHASLRIRMPVLPSALREIRKFSDPPLEVCPHCGGRLEKLISSPAFHLKGSGWYATD